MPSRTFVRRAAVPVGAVAVIFAAVSTTALAQSADAPSGQGLATTPSPYYLGANQAFTHDSNVYRVPFGVSDNYSSTTLLAGFDQPISRQRVFGTVSTSFNRYQDQTQLNNTSYALVAGVDWATVGKLSGNVTTTLDQRLVAPVVTADAPVATRNLERRKGLSGLARWGGESTLSLEGRLGYYRVDYSGDQNSALNSTNETGSIGLFYRPGALLRLGVALRADRTRTPNAFQQASGVDQGNESRTKNLDLLAEYTNGNAITALGRASYTRQTNTGTDSADFSGLTGSLNLNYRATGKIVLSLSAARDAGFNAQNGVYGQTVAVVTTPGTTTPVTVTPINTPAILYENNQVTNTVSGGISYAATSKIGLTANGHYSRARILTSSNGAGQATTDLVDMTRGAGLGVNYAFSRAWTFACGLSRDRREVSGVVSYAYTADTASCSAQFLWR